ncbi:type II pantothenate kinase [Protomyces lactucae-debilis]|uniref:Type II pantothenate kinase n=1 Tax=Protomyces lactucae-debilis TaxID=2754530 RepID=A0A1Y2FPI0_PROLT|nr:type II pantothenate kinase [Protomyces lactucae-debilis]ORY85507.1 type II pantothenate kinase [Protomyces lactucae-debilis]
MSGNALFPRSPSVRINVEGARIVEDDDTPQTGRDIQFPFHDEAISHIAVDIGGSLAKVVYFKSDHDSGVRLNFTRFETADIQDLIHFLGILIEKRRAASLKHSNICIMATGGGAYKFYEMIKQELGVNIYQEDEMQCLIVGLDFFINEIPGEVFTFGSEAEPMKLNSDPVQYPYLLCNIGSGVSMIKVSGPDSFERIGGSSLGGGTLWGLLSLITGAKSFDEMLDLSAQGDNTKVDMLVGDIYGQGYGKIGLKASTIASTFGKVFGMQKQHEPDSLFGPEDVSRSLLYAISNNIGQIAYLQAQKHSIQHIYFGGSYIRGHAQTMMTLSYAINFWSGGQAQAYFLRHEGYLGSVGAFLLNPHAQELSNEELFDMIYEYW